MPYRIKNGAGFWREVDKMCRKQARWKKSILEAIKAVHANPQAGDAKVGNARGVLSISFERSPEMRILYEYVPCCVVPDFCEEPMEGCEGIVHLLYVRTRADSDDLYGAKRNFWKGKLLNPDGKQPPKSDTDFK
jgi:hypothetical protein